MPSVMMKRLGRDQRGITGVETAIVLIAFVVVASVFAYTVLSAGVFSSEKSKEAIYAGLEQARGTMELVGSVKATSIAATTIDNLEIPGQWVPSGDVTNSTEASDYKQGANALDVAIAAAFTTGLITRSPDLSVDLTSPQHYAVQMWIKATGDTTAGQIELVLDDTSACISPLETIDIPALATDTWEQVTLDLAVPTTLSSIVCVGLNANSDPGTITLTIDGIEAPKEVTSVSFLVANALDGEPIDLNTTTDADNDGLISDEATKNHTVSVIYADASQRTTDVTWTRTELGKGDGDSLLEPGEKMKIQVNTIAADPMPVGGTTFQITLVRDSGADLTFERTLPTSLTTEMDLN